MVQNPQNEIAWTVLSKSKSEIEKLLNEKSLNEKLYCR
jgi:hypothetical protein